MAPFKFFARSARTHLIAVDFALFGWRSTGRGSAHTWRDTLLLTFSRLLNHLVQIAIFSLANGHVDILHCELCLLHRQHGFVALIFERHFVLFVHAPVSAVRGLVRGLCGHWS